MHGCRIEDLKFPFLVFVSTPLYELLTESFCLALASRFCKSLFFSPYLKKARDQLKSYYIIKIIIIHIHHHHITSSAYIYISDGYL